MAESGLLTEVRWEWDGTIIAADALAGSTVLTVGNVLTIQGAEVVLWIDEEGPYNLVEWDTEANTITIDPPLLADVTEADAVVPDAGGGPGQIWVAEVILADADTPIEVPLTVHDLVVMPEGIYDPPKNITIEDDYQKVLDLPGNLPAMTGGYIEPGTGLPDPTVPTEPPAFSPSLIARGTSAGVVLATVEVVDPSTLIEYHMTETPPLDGDDNPLPFTPTTATLIDGPTRATVKSVSTTPDGNRLDKDTTYFFRTVATNIVDDTPPGPMTQSKMDMNNIAELFAEKITAGFILAGQITVGQITIDPETGITIPQPDGGTIHLPANGVDPARITAHITARTLTMEVSASFYGTTQIFGILQAAYGTTAPTSPATVGRMWPRIQSDLKNELYNGDNVTGLCQMIGEPNYWMTAFEFFGGYFRGIHKSTGATFPTALMPANGRMTAGGAFHPRGGITVANDHYYVLGQDSNRGEDWWIFVYDSAFVKTDEFLFTADRNIPYQPAIGARSNGEVFVIFMNKELQTQVRRFSSSGALLSTDALALSGSIFHFSGAYWGPADTGIDTIFAQTKTLGLGFAFLGTTKARRAAVEFDSPGLNAGRGLWWDETRFRSLDDSMRVFDYSRNWFTQNLTVTHTWYDGDNGGTGKHETDAGPIVPTTLAARSWLTVSTPAPPDSGNDSPTALDKANMIRVYAGAGATRYLVQTLGVDVDGNTIVDIDPVDLIPTSGDVPPPLNGFLEAETPPGQFESTTKANGTPLWVLKGDGVASIRKMSQAGYATATQSSSTTGTVDVVFKVPFDSPPAVVITPQQTTIHHAGAINITAVGFTIQVRRFDNASASAQVLCSWVAHVITT